MRRWYVANTHPKSESKALWHLRNQGFEAYLPSYRKQRRHARKVEAVRRPLFPSYLFIEMDIGATRWRAIRSTIGIRHLIANGEMPAPVPDGVVEDIQAREDDDGLVPIPTVAPFDKGEAVEVTGGPLKSQVGFFECVSDDERIIILLNMLGRQIRVPVPFGAVRAYS